MGKMLAQRLIGQSDSDVERLEFLYQLLTSRAPRTVERDACLELLSLMKKRYTDAPDAGKALLATGDSKVDASIPVVDHAAWTQVAITVLASDAAISSY